jgi:hypothetical protein
MNNILTDNKFDPRMLIGHLVDLMTRRCAEGKTNTTEVYADAIQGGLPVRLWLKLTIVPRAEAPGASVVPLIRDGGPKL